MEALHQILIGPDAPAGAYGLTLAWLFVVGAAIGSFLNVVTYRLPRGMSVVHPGSRCGSCGHPIRWYDNLPVLSWFILRGRCRDCGASFSIRYPLVEAATGAMFVALAMAGPLSSEPVVANSAGHLGLWLVFALRAGLLSTLWAAAWIKLDGNRIGYAMHAAALLCAGMLAMNWDFAPPRWAMFEEHGFSDDSRRALGAFVSGWIAIASIAVASRLRPRQTLSRHWDLAPLAIAFAISAGPNAALLVGIALATTTLLTRLARTSQPWPRYVAFVLFSIAVAWFSGGESLLARCVASL
jgi:prepilin signal peptidase PulO-like enzyme (type II secretory pathway)